MKKWRPTLLVFALLASPVQAGVVLYDGSLSSLPSSQGWLYLTNPFLGASSVQTVTPEGVALDTRAKPEELAGYFLFPTTPLDRNPGFDLRVDLRVLDEAHSSSNRAGFSLLLITTDLKAIELDFWKTEVWAQKDSPLFTHGEGGLINTTASIIRYDVSVAGNGYSVKADGAPLVSGLLRDYSSFGPPYNVPNVLFLGDNTSSAAANVTLARVEYATVPEASSVLLISAALAFVGSRRRLLSHAPDNDEKSFQPRDSAAL